MIDRAQLMLANRKDRSAVKTPSQLQVARVKAREKSWAARGEMPTRRPGTTCDLCGEAFETLEAAHYDHDHETGKFRGWLHRRCNTALGWLGDNEEGLRRALAYLERAKQEKAVDVHHKTQDS